MRLTALVVTTLLWAPAARAAEAPRAELFGGYSYLDQEQSSLHGWDAALAWNVWGRLGLELDVAGHYGDLDGTQLSRLAFLAGPRLAWHGERMTPFLHLLAGGIRTRAGIEVLGVSISETDTDFGGAAGGGAVFNLGRRFGVRVQADYLVVAAEGETTGDLRASAGVSYRFGR